MTTENAEPDPKLVHAVAGKILEFVGGLDHSVEYQIAGLRVVALTLEESLTAHQLATMRSNMAWNMRRKP